MASDAVVNLVVNATQGEAQINAQLRHLINTAERNAPPIVLNVQVDNRTIHNTINQINGDVRGLNRSLGDADDSGDRLGSVLSRIGSASRGVALASGRVLALGTAAATSVPLVAGLATAVESILPAATVAVSGFVALQAASLTLKIGLLGVEDAISAVFDPNATPEKLEKALKGLSKNARSFVLELRNLKPAFDKLRLDVQDRLFAGLDKTLAATAKTTFPVLRTAAENFADTFNVMAKNTANTAQDLSKDGTLGRALKSGSDAFGNLSRVPSRVLEAIVRLAEAGGPQLDRITDKVADIVDSLTIKLRDASKSGELKKSVDDAVATLEQLGRIAGNVFGTIGNILGVANSSGKGLFGTLEQVTQALEEGTETPLFQRTLRSLIDLGQTLVSNVLPLLGQAFAILAPVILQIVPPIQRLVELLGDRLSELLPELAPVLEQLATNFGQLLEALTPLIESGFDVLVAIMPSLLDLMNSVSLLIQNLAPLIEQLAPLLAVVLVGAIVILVETITFVTTSLANLFAWIQFVIDRWKDFASTIIDVVINAFQLVIDLVTGDFSGAWEHLQNIVGDVAGFIGRTVSGLKDTLVRIIGNLADLLPSGMRRVFDRVAQAVRDRATAVIGAVRDIGGRMISAVTDLGGDMYTAGRAILESLVEGILSKVGDVAGAVESVVSKARELLPFSPAKRGPFSGRGYPLYSGIALMDALATGILQRSGAVQAAMAAALGDGINPSLALAGTGSTAVTPAGTAGAGPTLAAAGSSVFLRSAATTVNVHIGNEAITRFVKTIVDDSNDQRDRLAAQGTRI